VHLEIPRRLYSLDALRGIAAIAVVFSHWPHFFYNGTERVAVEMPALPLYAVFASLYHNGWLGVDLFFCLSGFVFYWLYSGPVSSRAISARDFFVLRFSRLYPLHLATLLAVALGQALMLRATGSHFIYGHNDAYHFVLNVLFAPAWGFEEGYSFNAPVWSVSVEVLLYAAFFALCRLLPVRAAVLVAAAAVGLVLVAPSNLLIGRGITAFFIGGGTFLVYRRLVAAERVDAVLRWLPWVAAALWLLLPLGLAWLAAPIQHRYFAALVLFPVTILSLALFETQGARFVRRLAFLGDISYGSYLLHFPLQLAAVGLAGALASGREVFYSPWTLAAFIAVLVAASFASHRLFEMPAQRALRKRGLTYAFL
jgi:peptidoglycan/LPS O-acetylase OafA/YrhL